MHLTYQVRIKQPVHLESELQTVRLKSDCKQCILNLNYKQNILNLTTNNASKVRIPNNAPLNLNANCAY